MNQKVIYQESMYDCGLACLNTILWQFGYKTIPPNKVVINNGLSAYTIIKLSKKQGLDAKGVKTDLYNLSINHCPCIAHIVVNNSYFHYIVILKNMINKKSLLVHDPSFGIKTISYDEFNKLSTGIFILFNKDNKIPFKLHIKKDKRFTKIVKSLLKENKKNILKIVFLSIISVCLNIVFASYFKIIYQFQNYFLVISFLFVIIVFLKNIINYFKEKLIVKLQSHIDYSLNKKLINHLFLLPFSFYQHSKTGELINIISDNENFKNIIIRIFIIFIIDITFIIVLIIYMSFYSFLYLVILILLLIFGVFISLLFQKYFNNYYLNMKNSRIDYSNNYIKYLTNINYIKNFCLENKIIKLLEKNHYSLNTDRNNYQIFNNKYNLIMNILEELAFIFVIVISIFLINNDIISVLELLIFGNLFNLYLSLLQNINETILMYQIYKSSVEKVLRVLDIEKNKKLDYFNNDIKEIKINNLYLKLNKYPLFNNLNLIIRKNDLLFLEGFIGSGKTTLMNILLNNYDYQGEITINNEDIKQYNTKDLITYVGYNTLFYDSIYNNLCLVNDDNEMIEKVIKVTRIDTFIKEKGIDLNYLINETNDNLSGGEVAKIKIAQALLRNKSFIIFDESFKEIDEDEERVILQNIIDNYNLTIIFISHRNTNKDLFNRHLILKEGKIYEEEQNEKIN